MRAAGLGSEQPTCKQAATLRSLVRGYITSQLLLAPTPSPPPAVDLLGVDLDAAVSIERGRINLYPGPASAGDAPAAASSANAPAGAKAPGRTGAAKATPAGRGPQARRAAPAAAKQAPAQAAAQPVTSAPGNGAPRLGLPPPGQGLNKAALVTFRRMGVKAGADAAAADALRAKLAEASARMGGVFVHYDPADGVWLVKLDAWQ